MKLNKDGSKRRKAPRMPCYDIEPVAEINADEIRDIRLWLQLSQQTFADVLGVSVKAVEAWEHGRCAPGGASRRLMDLYYRFPYLIPFASA